MGSVFLAGRHHTHTTLLGLVKTKRGLLIKITVFKGMNTIVRSGRSLISLLLQNIGLAITYFVMTVFTTIHTSALMLTGIRQRT